MNLTNFLLNNLIVEDTREILESHHLFLKTRYNEKYYTGEIPYITPGQLFRALGLSTKFVGITGTNGKTTTAFALSYILHQLGFRVATQGTEGFFYNLQQMEGRSLTTPTLLTTLKRAVKYRPDFFIMEVSSHGIAQGRVEGIDWSLKIFTSFSQDHLDYHRSIEVYKQVKESFFSDTTPKLLFRTAPIRINPENGILIGEGLLKKLGKIQLLGEFNRENLGLAVAGALALTGKELEQILAIASQFEGVPGRMEVISHFPLIIIDYAHTPEGIERVLEGTGAIQKVVLFGAGGERDRKKRIKMGEVADRLADFIILTNDNPRCENPSQILADISKGIKNTPFIVIPNRIEAIKMGVNLIFRKREKEIGKNFDKSIKERKKGQREEYKVQTVRPIPSLKRKQGVGKEMGERAMEMGTVTNSIGLFLLGKGNENYIQYCNRKIPYSERETLLKILSQFQTGPD